MYEPSTRERQLVALTLASGVFATVFYGFGIGRVAVALAVTAGLSATWLLYIYGKRRGGGGGSGGDDGETQRRREKEMEAEVGGSGGHF